MKIGLVDVDSHNFPNLSLMKISSYHKQKGNTVEWASSLEHYDKVYMTKVFTFSKDDLQAYQCDELIQGGTGYNLDSKLPDEIENTMPDYSLYGIKNMAYGFLTRGCPRQCNFCIVGEKEGTQSIKVADLNNFWNGQKNIKLLDPNILACKDWEDLLKQLADSKAYIDFTQGLDIRLMTKEKAEAINNYKYKTLHFAWDNVDDHKTLDQLIKYRPFWRGRYKELRVYVLSNFNSTFEQDLYRIYKIREIGYDPFLMVYEKWNAPQKIKKLARWCNSKFVFRICEKFKDYKEV